VKRLAWLLLLPVAGGVLVSQDEPKKDQVGEAVVMLVEGDVEYRRPSDSKKWAALKKDLKLKGGDQIQTGLKSKCLLQLGEATRVLVRSSSFATLSRAFVEKNKIDGEVRLDVGSLYLEVDPAKKPENVDFKITTPMGTASIRGTSLFAFTGDMGSGFFQNSGSFLAGLDFGPPSSLDDNLKSKEFPLIGGGDLSVLNGMNFGSKVQSEPNLVTADGSTAPNQSFNQTQDFTQTGNNIGGSVTCAPTSTGTISSTYDCSNNTHWGMLWNTLGGPNGNFNLSAISQGVTVRSQNGPFGTEFFGQVGGTDLFHLKPTTAGPQNWILVDLITNRQYNWNPTTNNWQ
jgi:hypothetical protein